MLKSNLYSIGCSFYYNHKITPQRYINFKYIPSHIKP